MSNKKRYIIVMVLSVLMNFGFYQLSRILNLPVWMDFVGTIFAALTLEPAAGLLVGLVDNFYLAIFVSGNNAIIYYAISAVIAIVTGVCMRKKGKIKLNRILPSILLIVVISAVLSSVFTVWRTGGFVPDDVWEAGYYFHLRSINVPEVLSLFLATSVTKLCGTVFAGIIVTVFYFILPKSIIIDRQKLIK